MINRDVEELRIYITVHTHWTSWNERQGINIGLHLRLLPSIESELQIYITAHNGGYERKSLQNDTVP